MESRPREGGQQPLLLGATRKFKASIAINRSTKVATRRSFVFEEFPFKLHRLYLFFVSFSIFSTAAIGEIVLYAIPALIAANEP